MIRSKLAVAFLALSTSSTALAQMAPPIAPVKPVVDDYFGTKVTDPYRYMEDLKSDVVQTWMKGQAEFAKGALQRAAEFAGVMLHGRRFQTADHFARYRRRLARWRIGSRIEVGEDQAPFVGSGDKEGLNEVLRFRLAPG